MSRLVCWISRAAVIAALFSTLFSWPAHAASALSPEVTKGLAWLQTQVQTSGMLANEVNSIASPLQNRAEAMQTLQLLASAPVALSDRLAADTDDNTEYLSRRIVTLGSSGRDVSPLLAQLQSRQNNDGGFGGTAGVASNALDTAWAMLALAQSSLSNSPSALAARNFLLAAIQADGGVSGENLAARINASAISLLALQMSPASLNTATVLKKISTWLLLNQGLDGSWQNDGYLTATTLTAVSPLVSDPVIRTTARAFLAAQQGVDGSWGGDPFLTALVLRALAYEPATPAALTASIVGQVFDRNSATALANVSVALSGASSAIVNTAADGRLTFQNLVAGSYTLQITKSGYNPVTSSYQLNAAQSLDVGAIVLDQIATGGIVRGQVVGASTGAPLGGVAVALNGGAVSAVTDANGLYEFGAVPAGAVSISAALPGYISASGAGTLIAGQTLVFSPALYATGATEATTGRFLGKVVAAGGGGALAGVDIQLNGVSAGVTAGDGSFDLVLPLASYGATFAAGGYDPATTTFLITAGTVINAGTISLSPQLATTSIKGIVKDQATGQPINGAQVQLLTGGVVTTGPDGAYSFSSLTGTAFDLRATAAGYLAQSWQLQAPRASSIVQDLALQGQAAQTQPGAGPSFSALSVNPGSAASRADIGAAVTLSNAPNGSQVSGVLAMQIINSQGEVVGNAAAYDETGTNLVGGFVLAPAQQMPVMFRWNTAQFPPGTYSLVARVVEAGSISQVTPLGRVMTETQGTLTITADQHFAGTVAANPPVLQINTNTPVQLAAVVANDGNTDLPAQTYQLQVINEKNGAVLSTQQVTGNALAPNELQDLAFADWLPATGGGNFRIEIQALSDPALGKVQGKVYVGDAATAAFTVNKLVVPAGTQSVKGNIHIAGQDATQATISDPLAPLIKAAVQKAVTYNDAVASNWYVSNRCLGCHVVTQALVGGELNRSITTFNASQRQTLFNSLSTSQKSNGALYSSHPEYARTQTILGLWALNSWHNKSEIVSLSAKAANYLLGQQEASGSWSADHASGWWITRAANTGLTAKSLIEVDELLKQTPSYAAPVTHSLAAKISGASIPGTYKAAAVDAGGNIYLTTYSAGTLSLIKPDGTRQTLLSGLVGPRPPAFGADGALYIPSDAGVVRYTLDGQRTNLGGAGATGVAAGPDGNIYAANYWNNKISRITPAGVVSDYIVGGALSYPHGIAFDQTGALLVANAGNSRILKYAVGNTTSATFVVSTSGAPYSLLQDGSNWIIATSAGLYRYNSAWQGDTLVSTLSWSLARTPDGKILVGNNAADLFELAATPMHVRLDTAIAKAADWLLVDGNVDANSNLDLAHRLIGLGSAKRYFAGASREAPIQAKMEQVAATLRARQRSDGGWGWKSWNVSDSLVTAQVGYALDYLHPSPKDPVVQNAIKLLLKRQQPDGSWASENGVLGTRLAATTWVAIWLPVALDRIGGIDTDLTVSMPANVSLSNPSSAPTSSAANAMGGTDYVWKLQGVTSAGRDINFDLSLSNMTLGENRPVAADSYLTFNNSFTQTPVKAPISVPRVTASAFLDLGVTTDRTSYGANAPVNITAAVNNTSAGPLDGSVKLEIFGADDVLAASVGMQPFAGLAAGAQQPLNAVWDTSATAAGGYYVLATLFDAQNRQVGTAKSVFDVVPSTSSGTAGAGGVGAHVSVDKMSYQPFDAVRIGGRVTNLMQNQAQGDLQAVVTIYRPDGSVQWTQTSPLQQLAVGGSVDLGLGSQLNAAAVGKYRVTLSVQTLNAVEVAASETFFDVQSTADSGSGLSGTITATPEVIPQTDPAVLDWTVSNLGNAGIAALPVTVSIAEPATQQIMTQRAYTVTAMPGQPFQTAFTWDTDLATIGATYVAVLTATAGGREITLAQDNFTVTDPPVKLDVAQSAVRENRVLVWLACDAEAHQATEEQGHADEGAHADGDLSVPLPPCIQSRSVFLQGLLASYNVPHLIVTNRDDFRKAFREGRYNLYWLSGAIRLEKNLAKEIREAVYRGDSLILDGAQHEYSDPLQEAAGVEYRGRLPAGNATVTTSGPMFSAAQIPSQGNAYKLHLTSGAVQALFDLPAHVEEHEGEHQEEHPEVPHPAVPHPAIVGNDYGNGHALAFGFDLVGNLQNGTAPATWSNLLQTGLTSLMPPLPDTYSAGAYVTLTTRIRNLATRASDLAVSAHLPAGAALLQTIPDATLDATGQPGWNFNLPVAETRPLQLTMRLPALSGNHVLPVTIDSVRNGKSKRYGEYSFGWTVAGSDRLLGQVAGDLRLLVLIDAEEQEARDKALLALQQAEAFIAQARYAEALEALLEAVGKLRKIHSIDVGAQRLNLDRILQETGWNWLRAAGL